jgi:hypothetical protein
MDVRKCRLIIYLETRKSACTFDLSFLINHLSSASLVIFPSSPPFVVNFILVIIFLFTIRIYLTANLSLIVRHLPDVTLSLIVKLPRVGSFGSRHHVSHKAQCIDLAVRRLIKL